MKLTVYLVLWSFPESLSQRKCLPRRVCIRVRLRGRSLNLRGPFNLASGYDMHSPFRDAYDLEPWHRPRGRRPLGGIVCHRDMAPFLVSGRCFRAGHGLYLCSQRGHCPAVVQQEAVVCKQHWGVGKRNRRVGILVSDERNDPEDRSRLGVSNLGHHLIRGEYLLHELGT